MNLLSARYALAATLAVASHAAAQCTDVPGTGCPGALPVVCTGSPQLGQTMTLQCPAGTIGLGLLVAGFPTSTPIPISLLLPLPTCGGQTCTIDVDLPAAVISPGIMEIAIPSNPALIGTVVRSQCVEILMSLTGACSNVTTAVDFQVQ